MSSFIEALRAVLYGIFNIPYIPKTLRGMVPPLAVHVSDTPGFSYPYIYRLVRQLEPAVLIHTGDMIDDIKLEDRPAELGGYSRRLKSIIGKLEQLPVEEIYLVPGNHDDPDTMVSIVERSVVLPEKSWIELEGLCFFLSHKFYDIEVDADFYLFGHNLPEMTWVNRRTITLNGIPNINIISLSTGNTYTLEYPAGTDSARKLLLPRIGL